MSRKERRANPDAWVRLVGLSFDGKVPMPLPEHFQQAARGTVDDVNVFEAPAEANTAERLHAFYTGLTETFRSIGVEPSFIVVPHGTKIMCLRPVLPVEEKLLNREFRGRQVHLRVAEAKKDQADAKAPKPS